MRSLEEIYHTADQENIVVDRFALSKREALSIMDEDGNCYIAIDPGKISDESDERTKLSHEVGHCVTGAFYNKYSKYDCRKRHENRADKWAIQYLIDVNELDQAVADGCVELWQLAERFKVTEQFMEKAICFYTYGNVAAELYF